MDSDGWGPRGWPFCDECGRPYTDPGFPDLIVPDAIWEQISPTGDRGGLLCPSCIIGTCTEQGLGGFRAVFRSGPLSGQYLDFSPVRPTEPGDFYP